jgi:hypothetical protein
LFAGNIGLKSCALALIWIISPYRKSKTTTMATKRIKVNGGEKESRKKNWLLYGGLAIASIYVLRKVPFLRNLTLPIVATAATKYFRGMQSRMHTA